MNSRNGTGSESLRPASGLFGVALLPPADQLQMLCDAQLQLFDGRIEPRLGLTQNLPHVSLYQFPSNEATFEDRRADLESVLRSFFSELRTPAVSSFGSLRHQPKDWIFLDVERRSWMQDLQSRVVETMQRAVNFGALKDPSETGGYSRDERSSYYLHGYRYVGPTFAPHFTFGVGPAELIDRASKHWVDSTLRDLSVNFSEIVMYRAGEFGALRNVIGEPFHIVDSG